MKILKKIEAINRKITYFFINLYLRNKEIAYPLDIKKIKKILILRHDAIGDMIVTLPAIELIKSVIPNAEIHVFASYRNAEILKYDERVTKVIVHSGNSKKVFYELKPFKKENYDLVLSFVFSKTTLSGLISNYVAPKAIKVNPREENRAELYSTFFNIQIPIADLRDKITMLEILCRIVARLFNLDESKLLINYKIFLSKSNLDFAEDFSKLFANKKIFFNISAGNPYRMLSAAKNIELLKHILNLSHDYDCFVMYAPADKEKAESVVSNFDKRVFLLPDSNSILDIAAIIQKADIVITPDTSIVHLSALAGKPTITLYSRMASFINEWMPYNVPFEAVITKNIEPLENISIEDIGEAFMRISNKCHN